MKVGNGAHGFPCYVESVFSHQANGKEKARGTTQVKDIKQVKSDATTQKGVIRHLQEGHFKGLAPARHDRENAPAVSSCAATSDDEAEANSNGQVKGCNAPFGARKRGTPHLAVQSA